MRYLIQVNCEESNNLKTLRSFFKDKHLREYPKGQILLYQAEETNNVCFIEEGYVKVYDLTASGEERLLLILGPGDVYPVIWTFRESDSLLYFYESITPAKILVSNRKELTKMIDESHEFTKSLLVHFVGRIKELSLRVECIEATNARHKVLQVLDYMIKSHPGKKTRNYIEIPVPLTHQSIANMAGLSRETASIIIKKLQDKKIVIPITAGYKVNEEKLNLEFENE